MCLALLLPNCAAGPVVKAVSYDAALKACVVDSHTYEEYVACADKADVQFGVDGGK